MARRARIELASADLEAAVLPLNDLRVAPRAGFEPAGRDEPVRINNPRRHQLRFTLENGGRFLHALGNLFRAWRIGKKQPFLSDDFRGLRLAVTRVPCWCCSSVTSNALRALEVMLAPFALDAADVSATAVRALYGASLLPTAGMTPPSSDENGFNSKMAGPARLELATSESTVRRSGQLN